MDWIKFPKVDLHRHLEGSLRFSTLEEIAASPEYQRPGEEIERLRSLLGPDDSRRSPEAFLAKFPIIRGFFVSPEMIARLAYEAVADAAADGLRYLELRFNPAALGQERSLSLGLAADSVIAGVRKAENDFDILVRLIVTVNRAEAMSAGQLMQVAAERLSEGVVGIDLAGDEVHIPADPYVDLFNRANSMGLGTTAHAGEWAGAEKVRFAIEELKADRIGHGIRIVEDAEVLALARERNSVFEVCITSNIQTNAVAGLAGHPLAAMAHEHGLKVTLNTDDPGLSGICLSGELSLAHEKFGFSIEEIRGMTLEAVDRAFLDSKTRESLRSRLESDFRALDL
jgi:adenosine deaminase